MTMPEAIRLCLHGGHRVRPVCWRELFPSRWVERLEAGGRALAVLSLQYDDRRMTQWLILSTEDEYLGEWEVVIDDETT